MELFGEVRKLVSGIQFRPLASVDGLEKPQANTNETLELVDEWTRFIKMDRKMRGYNMQALRIIAEKKMVREN